jgi:hypothetical protein
MVVGLIARRRRASNRLVALQHVKVLGAALRLAACPDTGLNLDIIGEVLYLVSG